MLTKDFDLSYTWWASTRTTVARRSGSYLSNKKYLLAKHREEEERCAWVRSWFIDTVGLRPVLSNKVKYEEYQ